MYCLTEFQVTIILCCLILLAIAIALAGLAVVVKFGLPATERRIVRWLNRDAAGWEARTAELERIDKEAATARRIVLDPLP